MHDRDLTTVALFLLTVGGCASQTSLLQPPQPARTWCEEVEDKIAPSVASECLPMPWYYKLGFIGPRDHPDQNTIDFFTGDPPPAGLSPARDPVVLPASAEAPLAVLSMPVVVEFPAKPRKAL